MTERDIVERLMAASHDDRLSTGALYREAANEIDSLRVCVREMAGWEPRYMDAKDEIRALRELIDRLEAAARRPGLAKRCTMTDLEEAVGKALLEAGYRCKRKDTFFVGDAVFQQYRNGYVAMARVAIRAYEQAKEEK